MDCLWGRLQQIYVMIHLIRAKRTSKKVLLMVQPFKAVQTTVRFSILLARKRMMITIAVLVVKNIPHVMK